MSAVPTSPHPWLALYRPGTSAQLRPDWHDALAMFSATARRRPQGRAVTLFDGHLTWADLDRRTDALALSLGRAGVGLGDRVAIYAQNDPAFVVALVATFKAGGIAVMINPMNKVGELDYLLTDSGATALVCLDELYAGVVTQLPAGTRQTLAVVVTYSGLDDQRRDDARVYGAQVQRLPVPEGVLDLARIIDDHDGSRPQPRAFGSDDVAVLSYTSGTTGTPKGAMNTHGNIAANAQTWRDWMDLGSDDIVLGIAPLFHITGLVAHVGLCLLTGAELVLVHRFEPHVVMDAVREHRPTFAVGAITAYIALMNSGDGSPQDWACFRCLYSGGAPIAPAITASFRDWSGRDIHNVYGLTETASVSHAVPLGAQAPVDPTSGALSVGVPTSGVTCRILGPDGEALPAGEIGELATRGPQVTTGYWGRPEASAQNVPDGELRTGDVAFMDEQGWFYLVDRKKDMINASGYKVWPREVEDVLYGHPDVREVAVVGVPDDYRGESVKAYVSLKAGASVSAQDLIAYGRERMAAYKYPREIEIIEELPKTATGKILRRTLRAQAAQPAPRQDRSPRA